MGVRNDSASKATKRPLTAASFWRTASKFSSPLLRPKSFRRLLNTSTRDNVVHF